MSNVEVDKGWSWLVCVGGVVAMFLEAGMVKALGVLFPVLREQFATKTWIIGLVISLVTGFGAVTCPLAGVLSKHFSARWTVMVYTCLAALGLIMGSFSTSIPAIVVAFLLASFTIGAEAIVLGELARYFDQKYNIANSIAQMGLSLGVMIIPLLTQFLIDIYGWRGTMLLLGALNAHMVLSGVVMRPTKTNAHKHQHISARTYHEPSAAKQDPSSLSLLNKVVYYLDLKLFNDINILSVLWYKIGNGYCLTGWLIYLVPYAMAIGVTPYRAAALATFGGVGNLLGNTIYPFATGRFKISPILYTSTFISCVSLAVNPIFSNINNYAGLILSSAAFGFGRGLAILCSYQIVKDISDEESRTNSIMWICVAFSFGSIASGFLSGWLYDQTGSFAVSFFILSGVALLAIVPQVILDTKVSKHNNYEYTLISSSLE